MTGSWTIKPATTADAEAMHDIYHRVRPNWPIALDRIAARIANPKMVAMVAADHRGRIAGYAVANALSHISAVFTNVYVDPIQQERGVGSLLWSAIEREAAGFGPNEAQGYVQDNDERSLAIIQRWGFEVVEPYRGGPSQDTYVLHLGSLDATFRAEAPAGYELRSVAELESSGLADVLWPLYVVAVTDKPRWDDDEADVDKLRDRLESERLLPGGSLVVFRDDQVVGFTILTEIGPRTAHVDLTVVDRADRGRGLATLLKRRSATWAHDAGYERLITESRSDNAPIVAVNRKLGFRPVQLLQVTRPLTRRS